MTVEWKASPANDIIADSVVALIMHSQGSAASVRFTSQKCSHSSPEQLVTSDAKRAKIENDELLDNRISLFGNILKERFVRVDTVREGYKVTFEIAASDQEPQTEPVDGAFMVVQVEFLDGSASVAHVAVECADENIAKDVRRMLQRAANATSSISTNSLIQ